MAQKSHAVGRWLSALRTDSGNRVEHEKGIGKIVVAAMPEDSEIEAMVEEHAADRVLLGERDRHEEKEDRCCAEYPTCNCF